MSELTEKRRLAILRVLRQAGVPLGSSKITGRLLAAGHEMSERTVRFYLQALDHDGLTKTMGRKGRILTDRGVDELASARIIERVGFLAAKIDQMTYRMSFDLSAGKGTVLINVSIIKQSDLGPAIPLITRVFRAGYAMGRLIAIFTPGQQVGDVLVPHGTIAIGTVCSITVNGVLLANGIPTYSRFGGLLEVRDKKPTRFVEVIDYGGTTLDPLEVFVRSGMTDHAGATETGYGKIGASFREAPAECRETVITLAHQLEAAGLGGFLAIGWPGQSLTGIPVEQGRFGMVIVGGLNPTAILGEKGIRAHLHALAALTEYQTLFPYDELDARVRNFA